MSRSPKVREQFFREFDFEIRDTSEAGDGRSFVGYAALFNSPTRINSWEGDFTESIKPGAFRRTLEGRVPSLQYAHGKHAAIGDLPLGLITKAVEDERGLRIEARLHESEIFAPIREAIATGALNSMSFRFEAIKETWSADRKTRTLTELRVPEVSVVLFPAYSGTTASVRDDILRSTSMNTKAERQAALRRVLAGLPAIPGQAPTRHRQSKSKAERLREVAALRARSGMSSRAATPPGFRTWGPKARANWTFKNYGVRLLLPEERKAVEAYQSQMNSRIMASLNRSSSKITFGSYNDDSARVSSYYVKKEHRELEEYRQQKRAFEAGRGPRVPYGIDIPERPRRHASPYAGAR